MTTEDATPRTRRELRARAGEEAPVADALGSDDAAPTSDVPAPGPSTPAGPSRLNEPSPLPMSAAFAAASPVAVLDAVAAPPSTAAQTPAAPVTDRVALTWVDPDALPSEVGPQTAGFELLPPLRRPRRRFDARVVVIPAVAVVSLVIAYVAAMALWPLSAVEPTVTAAEATALRGTSADVDWPSDGTGAVAIEGFTPATSTGDADQLASLTKLVTALVVLDAAPLESGEQGPSYDFTFADRSEYWQYIAGNQSALNVPDGGSLTEYQLLQGTLIASASNYADRLVTEVFGSVDEYTAAATAWLDANDIDGVTITDASGFDRGNEATPAAIIALAEKALANPVIAEIVATDSAELPGAGVFENTNALLGESGVIGVKTGSYAENYNLVAARTLTVGDQELTLLASVTGQPTDDLRVSETRRLLEDVATEASVASSLAAGTVVAGVTTAWGASSQLVTDADASLLLWNGATAQTEADYELGEAREEGAAAGTLTLTGPAGSAEVGVELASDVPGPDLWWRLSHPLELLGIG